MSEQELIKRCKSGDSRAFETLIEAYEKKILNYCFRMLGNSADAEDAAQEAFIKMFRFIGSFTEQSSFSTWMYKIASNVCLDWLRKNKRKNNETISLYQDGDEGEEFALPLEDDSPSPYHKLQQNEAQRALCRALEALGEEQKKVIILRDIQGLSYEEIAQVTGMASGTVKSRINRARLALKKILEKDRELFLT